MQYILFRGKRVDNGEWVEGNYYESKISGCFILSPKIKVRKKDGVVINDSFEVFEVIPETVGEFIGKTDKNGKKIFEGDIVKVTYTEKRQYQGVAYDDKHSCVEEIFYSEESACFMLKITLKDIPMYRPLHNFENLAMIESIEVIGNIHDNPELLKEYEKWH